MVPANVSETGCQPPDSPDSSVGFYPLVWTALQDAASVAGLLVTTEAMVAEKPEKKGPAMAGGGGMGGMGDMDF